MRRNKRAQEEMVGFILIVVLVVIILLVLLALSMGKKEIAQESYKVQSFINTLLGTTTSCEEGLEFKDIQEIISICQAKEECNDGRNSCEVLEESVKNAVKEAWKTERTSKGFIFNITSNGEELVSIKEGNSSGKYQGNSQPLNNGASIGMKVFY